MVNPEPTHIDYAAMRETAVAELMVRHRISRIQAAKQAIETKRKPTLRAVLLELTALNQGGMPMYRAFLSAGAQRR